MNREQVREILVTLDPSAADFTLVFSGKTSGKVDGLYKPDSREIVIHNRNMKTDNSLLYTAIHEFAHHLHFTRSPVPVGPRSHTREYWSIFHGLLERAENLGLYRRAAAADPELSALTREIRSRFLEPNGELMKEFGRVLIRAAELCKRLDTSFEDYLDRELGIRRTSAHAIINVFKADVDPRIGFENMKTVARISDDETRRRAESAFLQGKSPDTVEHEFLPASKRTGSHGDGARTILERERESLRRRIERLTERLQEIEARLESAE